jgi:hypothetical protein
VSDTVLKTQFDCGSITVSDGTSPTPLEVVAQFDRGDFSTTGLMWGQRETTAYQTRGQLRALRRTSVTFPAISFSMMLAEFSDDTAGTVIDMILGTGEFADRTRTTRVPGDVVTLDVAFRVEGALGTQVLEFRDVHLVADVAEGDPTTVTLQGVVYGAIVVDGQEAPAPIPSCWVDEVTLVPQTGTKTYVVPTRGVLVGITWERTAGGSYNGGTPTYTVDGDEVFPASVVAMPIDDPVVLANTTDPPAIVEAGSTLTITTNSGGGAGPAASAWLLWAEVPPA